MILRILNWQGIAGIAVAFTLMVMLTVQKLECVHWKKQSDKFEQLYQQEQAAFALTAANYRAAAEQAKLADKANFDRVAAEQRTINERTTNEYEARVAAARSLAQRLRGEAPGAAADAGSGGSAAMPDLPAAPGGPAEAAGEDGFSQSDQLTATEQAIQLDELITWVRQQHAVDQNGATGVESSSERR
jgi:hypothetical protein